MWKLVIEDDEGKRTVVPLTRDQYTIGRKDGNTIRLTERNVSRTHAKLSKMSDGSDKRYILEDLTSYNGVFVNGQRIVATQELTHGDLIQIGDYRVVYQDDAISVPNLNAAQSVTNVNATTDVATAPMAVSRASLLMDRPDRLVMLAGPTPGTEYPLDRERMLVGRAEEAHISVNHNSVSRIHCEIHALAEDRFEIVDKGSSNGVRINGADLRRGIIEAGDIIELGDVKFKFVGAGQIFRPGATESQQLTAISDRIAANLAEPRKPPSRAAPFFIFFAVVGVGAAFAWFITRPSGGTGPVATVNAASGEQVLLEEAKKQCLSGACEVAHERLNAGIPADSPLRKSPEFRDIENRWADALLVKSDAETDTAKKISMLRAVAAATTIDDAKRTIARDRLMALTAPSADSSSSASVIPDAPIDAGRKPTYDAGPKTAASESPTTTATSPTAPTTKPSTGNDFEKDRMLVLQGDKAAAKRNLEARVYGGKGTPDDIRMLKSLCKEFGDKGCVEQCRKLLPQ